MDLNFPHAALGSGGVAAMFSLKSGYQPDLALANAKQLVINVIVASIRNDLRSGLHVNSRRLEFLEKRVRLGLQGEESDSSSVMLTD